MNLGILGGMGLSYEIYQESIIADIKDTLNELGTQPVLFIGSGISKRYFNAPNWIELLKYLYEKCPKIPHQVEYYLQDGMSPEDIGEVYTNSYREWAWENKDEFPKEFFEPNVPKSIYIKYKIAEYLDSITPMSIEGIEKEGYRNEVKLLQDIQPHAIITTNYDKFIENIFFDYQPIIGQKILKPDTMSIGEIFKIHGGTSEYQELVFNSSDYEEFLHKKKYLSAKLLTFFAEHPLIFLGYSATDKNIQRILTDIDEIISTEGDLIPNIYFLEFNEHIIKDDFPQKEKVLLINEKEIRIKYITANEFDWVFEALGTSKAWDNVHPKLLRALLARTYKLVRTDIPRRSVDVDFDVIEKVVSDDQELPNLYGVAMLDDPSQLNIQYPYTLTQVGENLGFSSWHNAHKLINQIRQETGINIKETDNKYHILIKIGRSEMHKYSKYTIELLEQFENGESIELNL